MTQQQAAMQLGLLPDYTGQYYQPDENTSYKIEHMGTWCFGGDNDWFPVIQFLIPGNKDYTSIRVSESVKYINP